MLIEKEVIAPGVYWYTDQESGLPRKLDVTPDLTRYWCEQGSAMLSAGLTVPVPCEHDFNAHPMTPKDKLLNNAGWVREYRLKDIKRGDPLYDPKRGELKDVLFAATEISDPEVVRKLPTTIRWTSPWINSFTDGQGKQWNNVISHLALTTRPRITQQSPFQSIAAALSMATLTAHVLTEDEVAKTRVLSLPKSKQGFFLSRAGLLGKVKGTSQLSPRYPIAFSLFSGATFGEGEFPPKKGKKTPIKGDDPTTTADNFGDDDGDQVPDDIMGGGDPSKKGGDDTGGDDNIDLPPLGDKQGDVTMEEVLCDLLRALGVNCEHNGDEQQFKRNLYAAAMEKVHELTNKGMNKDETPKPGEISKDKPPGSPGAQQNPIVQQETQPMYMSLEDISRISDPTMKTIALSMYNENVKLQAKLDANEKTANSLRDRTIKEASVIRAARITMLSKVSPKVKNDLEAMVALPSMALSMGDGGSVTDPMAQTLAILEKGLSDVPALLTNESSALFAQPQPTDQDMLSSSEESSLVDSMARMAGAPPEKKSA